MDASGVDVGILSLQSDVLFAPAEGGCSAFGLYFTDSIWLGPAGAESPEARSITVPMYYYTILSLHLLVHW